MLKSDVTIYKLLWDDNLFEDREKWFADRQEAFNYKSELEGEEACEEAFNATEAPPIAVGDVVRIETLVKGLKLADYYLCKSDGWEKFEGNIIQLLKHFSW